jgi:hypothetical protein
VLLCGMDNEHDTADVSVTDPTLTDPTLYRVLLDNDRVRVLEFRDAPNDQTNPHHHPDSVMITLSAYSRHLTAGGQEADVDLAAGQALWLPAQEHAGLNTGSTATHAIFIELKQAPLHPPAPGALQHLGPLSPRPLTGTPLSDDSDDEERGWGFA